ncbi:TatD family hydrolase, partial [Candidatus Parcubacteria bacterium]|nr:TatD family hydrolase [Candidatus Parcubacteria bacterium]
SQDAYDDTLRILHSYFILHNSRLRGVAHSFSGTTDEAREFLDLGFYTGFTGVITFKNAENLREVVRFVPLDRILVETDAPFLAPEPHRGTRNEPAWVELVARKVAEVKNEPIGRVAEMTTENARTLFKIE